MLLLQVTAPGRRLGRLGRSGSLSLVAARERPDGALIFHLEARPCALIGDRDGMMVSMPDSPKVLKLDEIEALPGPGTLRWHPVRSALGIRAFGCNAYTAQTVGADVVEPHTEDPDPGHQELYFVASGRAVFTIDGQRHDAPAGTYVFIPDPSSHRHAVAGEPDTTVLSFGGPPTFTPSAWEWTFRAAGVRRSSPDAARVILKEGLILHPDNPSLLYELACLDSVSGQHNSALVALARAIEAKPEIRAWARGDDDFDALRANPDFVAMTTD